MKVLRFLLLLILLIGQAGMAPVAGQAQLEENPEAQTINSSYIIGEGNDFATRSLGDAWDMTQFSDVSQWLNRLGPNNSLTNLQIQNGVFSARTTGSSAYFFALYGGYEPGFKMGKTGRVIPISSNQYSCFSMAMFSDAVYPGYYQLTWGDDVIPPTFSGMSYGNLISGGIWKLYQFNLKTWPYISGSAWTSRPEWQSFRIIPALAANVSFSIDWLRLTDCNPVYINLAGIPSGNYSITVGTGTPERKILAVERFSPQANGSYAWDIQGLAPGTYTYYVTPASPPSASAIQQGQLIVKPSPTVRFTRPSPTSGAAYSIQSEPLWNMIPSSVTSITCADWSFNNGILSLNTLPPNLQPPQCIGSALSESDPHIYLSTPVQGDMSAYRYLSVSTWLDGAWSLPEEGMILRLFWKIHRPTGQDCYYISREIPLDVGWHTYSADLYNSWNGEPASITPAGCPYSTWYDQGAVGPTVSFIFDPNENITNTTIHQKFGWIRLNQVDRVVKGSSYPIVLEPIDPSVSLQSLAFYYTTSVQNPVQNLAIAYQVSGSFRTFVPFLQTLSPAQGGSAQRTFNWNTSTVNPGEYFICSVSNDGYNQATNCSDAPVDIVAP